MPIVRLKIQFGKIAQYVSLASLFVVVFVGMNNFFSQWSDNDIVGFLLKIIGVLKNFQIPLIVITIILGAYAFFINREKIQNEIDKEKTDEEAIEQARLEKFPQKFPKIKNIPILQDFVKWCYKEGWWYSLTVIILIIIGFAIRLYKLGNLSLWWDELLTGTYVTRILETGVPSYISRLGYYWRGVAYHYFVSIFTFLFGNTEFWLRFPSVLFGMGITIWAFFYTKLVNKKAALLVLVFLIFSTYNIEYSRFARFYIMNAFLFMVAIWFFWKGFFKEEKRFKVISLIIFALMMHVVQLGAIFLSLWGSWSLYFIMKAIKFKSEKFEWRKLLSNLVYIIISLIIFLIGNILDKLIKVKNAISFEQLSHFLQFQLPKWQLFGFFNANYLPVLLVLIGISLAIALFYTSIKNKNVSFFSYLGVSLFISILLYEIGNTGVTGARIYFFAEALIVVVSILGVYLFIKMTSSKFALLLSTILFGILIINITPNFYERITIKYGEDVSNDPFQTTAAAAYRADYKNPFLYVKDRKGINDIVISVMSSNEFYDIDVPEYILNENSQWNMDRYHVISIDEDNFIYESNKSTIIRSADAVKKIIDENNNKKIWLIVNGASINVLKTVHVKRDFLKFLDENKDKVVYISPDGISRVLLFNN
jgi:4-amino-4-deoxy-L-arabinose transferase-like glycosyltransferase